ncbi:MAG: outer membrane protein insertion porin family [Bradymonadia bacterium]|jgi:outer membrane protein insertion porin family
MDTGFFEEVRWSFEQEGAGSVLVFEATPATLIRKLRVRAGAALGTELRRRVFLRSGEVWTGDAALVTRQAREIVEYFEDRGYFGTTVAIDVERVSDFVLDVIVDVERGRRKTVDRIYVRGHVAMDYDTVAGVLLAELNLMRTFTAQRFQKAQDALVRRYRELGFIQARVTFDDYRINAAEDTVDLFLEIREGPAWEISFAGNTVFTERELIEALTFYQTGFVDDAEIENAVNELRALYETVGRFFADVSVSATGGDDTRRLYFTIIEREPAEIRGVEFVGAAAVDPSVLRGVMETSEYDILSTGGYLQRSRLDRDLGNLVSTYRGQGYLEATVPRVVLVGENEGRELYLTVHIEEGPQTTVAGIEVDGVPERAARQLVAELLGEDGVGSPFDPARLRAEQAILLADLHARGFAFGSVETSCREGEEQVPCGVGNLDIETLSLNRDRATTCDRVQRRGRIVEECLLVAPNPRSAPAPLGEDRQIVIEHSVQEGRSVLFGSILVGGNFATRRRVIAREMPLATGEPYLLTQILEGQARLRQLGLFDSVRVFTIGATADPESGSRSHVVVQVEESSTRFLEHRIALELRAAPQSFLFILSNTPTFREINLLGRAKELQLFGSFDMDLLYTSRLANKEFRATAGIRYLARRFYMSRRMRDPWEAQVQLSYSYDLLAVAPAPLSRQLSLDARVREENDRISGLFFELGIQLSQTETLDQSDSLVVNTEFEPALILSLNPRVTLDRRRENPLNPTSGYFLEVELELADDFVGVLDSERFTKVTTRGSGFIPVGDNFVLGLNGRFGAAFGGILSGFQSDAQLVLPLSERYKLGGVTTVRGFADGGISSLDTDEFGGDFVINGNVELRYPFLPQLGLHGAVFLDVGQLMTDFSDLRFDEFRVTTGLGLRWLVADLIPIVVDYGALVDRRPGEGFGRLHLNVGYTF